MYTRNSNLHVIFLYLVGLLAAGLIPLPREMSFLLGKDENWRQKYDFVKFPSDNETMLQLRDVIPGKAKSPKHVRAGKKFEHLHLPLSHYFS